MRLEMIDKAGIAIGWPE